MADHIKSFFNPISRMSYWDTSTLSKLYRPEPDSPNFE